MKIVCPRCKQVNEWTGYPSNPILSKIMCVDCGFVGHGGSFRRMRTKKEWVESYMNTVNEIGVSGVIELMKKER